MRPTIFHRIRRLLEPAMADLGPGRPLCPATVATLHALQQVLADDPELPRAACEERLEGRARSALSWALELEAGARRLDREAQRQAGRPFVAADPGQRERVLRALAGDYPCPEVQSALRRRLRLTSRNLRMILSRPALRRFRRYVVEPLLVDYYTSARGWAVVGYEEFPGRVRGEAAECTVVAISAEGPEVVLQLSDGCFEPLRPDHLSVDAEGRFRCLTKGGRQTAVFSRAAQLALGELLEETPEGLRLVAADGRREVPVHVVG